MNARPDLIRHLRQLDELDTTRGALKARSTKLAALNAGIEAVRQVLPTAILKHYDQRRARGRPAVAPVSHGVCGGCHLAMTRGSLAALHRGGGALHVCQNCGVFIYLDESETRDSGAPSAP